MGDITTLLDAAIEGDAKAQDELYRRTEPELRKLALHWIRRKGARDLVRTTEVIDRAFLKLMKLGPRGWQHRGHFYAFACKNIPCVVIDMMREIKPPPAEMPGEGPTAAPPVTTGTVITLLDALKGVEKDLSARHRTIVELRFLGECTLDEIAELLSITRDKAFRESQVALLYLRQRLRSSFPNFGRIPQQVE